MAFGGIITQPGYRAPTSSMRGPRQAPRAAPGRPATAPRRRGALGGMTRGVPRIGGGGLPTMQPGAQRAPSAGGGAPSGATAQMQMPQAQRYKTQTYKDPNLGFMAGQGRGLMDPESDYYKRLSAGMQQQIGAQSAAQQRAAALRAAWGGMGGGRGGEMMQTSADISRGGLEAQGLAEAGLRLQAPMAGAQMVQSTFQPQLGYHQLTEGGRQFGAGLAEQARQHGIGAALQQQQIAAQQAQAQQQFAQQQQQFQQQMAQRNRELEWKAMMQQMAQLYA